MKLSDLDQDYFPEEFAEELAQRLSPRARLNLLAVSLRINERIHSVDLTMSFLTYNLTGCPLPPMFNFMDEARWWAQMATTKEKKAYLSAIFESLSKEDRNKFEAYYKSNADKLDNPANMNREDRVKRDLVKTALYFWGSYIERMDQDSWDYEFAQQINERRKWKKWYPSEKQKDIILRISREYSTNEENVEVVE